MTPTNRTPPPTTLGLALRTYAGNARTSPPTTQEQEYGCEEPPNEREITEDEQEPEKKPARSSPSKSRARGRPRKVYPAPKPRPERKAKLRANMAWPNMISAIAEVLEERKRLRKKKTIYPAAQEMESDSDWLPQFSNFTVRIRGEDDISSSEAETESDREDEFIMAGMLDREENHSSNETSFEDALAGEEPEPPSAESTPPPPAQTFSDTVQDRSPPLRRPNIAAFENDTRQQPTSSVEQTCSNTVRAQSERSPGYNSLALSPLRITRGFLESFQDQPQLPPTVINFSAKLDLYNKLRILPEEPENDDEELELCQQEEEGSVFDVQQMQENLQSSPTNHDRTLRPRKTINYRDLHFGN